MANWIECPTCGTDWNLSQMDEGSVDDTLLAFAKASDATAENKRLRAALEDVATEIDRRNAGLASYALGVLLKQINATLTKGDTDG